jgi:hypothetical protein
VIRVILVSGHLVDAPDRLVPRFPQARVPWVVDRVREVFDEWEVGPATTVIAGGARGADILAAEEGLVRGAAVILCLACPPERFVRESVELGDTDWADRFRRLLAVADVRQLADPPDGAAVFARTNEWMADLARRMDPQPRALFVWNGREGDGVGGTADMVRRMGFGPGDPRLRIIDPTPGAVC